MKLDLGVFELDLGAEADRIASRLREILSSEIPRRGFVVGMSGGIDSSVSAALCVRAVGRERVFGLLMPEQDSASASSERGRILAEHLGVAHELVDIGPALQAIGCYRWRDDAIRHVFPKYDGTWKNKIIISGGLEGRVNHFQLVVQTPEGETLKARLGLRDYLQIVAATNFKQRLRKTVEYCQADRLNYAVVGTPNRLEYDQGFFVKNGDGSSDVKPIAHLYKIQVYAMARHLALPDVICSAVPTTDTYSLPQGQDEFYFTLPFAQMDLALWALNHGCPASELAASLGITPERAERIFVDIQTKRRATRYLHAGPVLVEQVSEIRT